MTVSEQVMETSFILNCFPRASKYFRESRIYFIFEKIFQAEADLSSTLSNIISCF